MTTHDRIEISRLVELVRGSVKGFESVYETFGKFEIRLTKFPATKVPYIVLFAKIAPAWLVKEHSGIANLPILETAIKNDLKMFFPDIRWNEAVTDTSGKGWSMYKILNLGDAEDLNFNKDVILFRYSRPRRI